MQPIIAAVLLSIATLPLHAQSLRGTRAGLSAPVMAHRSAALDIHRATSGSHWREGMLIGAAVGAGFGLLFEEFGHNISDTPNSHVPFLGWVGLIGLFAVIGGLIGSASHRH